MLKRALDVLHLALEAAVGGVMLAAVFLVFVNVVARYVFSRPFAGAEEILQLMDVWVVMLGAAVIVRQNRHLNMDLLYLAMPPRLRRVVDVLITLLELALGGYVIAQARRVIALLWTTNTRTVVSSIPLALMYAALVLGFGSGVLFLIARLRAARARPGESALGV